MSVLLHFYLITIMPRVLKGDSKHDFANEQQISCATDYHHRLGNLMCKLLKTSAGQITAQGAVVCAALWPRHAAPNSHTKKKPNKH